MKLTLHPHVGQRLISNARSYNSVTTNLHVTVLNEAQGQMRQLRLPTFSTLFVLFISVPKALPFLQLHPWSKVCLRNLIFAQLITKLLTSQTHYCIHRSPPLVTNPKHMKSLNAVTVQFFMLHCTTILPSMFTSPKRFYHLLTK